MKPTILILLATGKTGYASAVQLLREGYPVRIYVRSRNAKALQLELLGAELFMGEVDQEEQLRKALQGIRHVYYCYPYKPGLARDVNIFIRAALAAQVEAVVFMGQRIAEFADTGSALTADVRSAYSAFAQSGLNVIYFAPGYFADNAFVVTPFVLQLGLMPNPFGEGKNPWISIGDMSRCIAALLKHPAPFIGQRLFPTGSQSISPAEMAAIFSKVASRRVRKVDIPGWLFLKAGIMSGREYGFDTYAIVQAGFYNRQMQLNRFDIPPTSVVKDRPVVTRKILKPFPGIILGNPLSANAASRTG